MRSGHTRTRAAAPTTRCGATSACRPRRSRGYLPLPAGSAVVGKTKPANAREKRRMDTIAKHCGCLPCLLMGWPDVHTSIEHVTDRGRRLPEEHRHTIGLCTWHHFGHRRGKMSRQRMSGEFGPPLTWGRTIFEEHFGDEVHVLVPTQDFMLQLFDENPWPEYAVPRHVARLVRIHWIDLNATPSRYIAPS